MSFLLKIHHGKSGPWLLTGLPSRRPAEFADLAACLDYAQAACRSAPATIELISDGIYVAVSQEDGWPQQLCRSPGVAARHRRPGIVLWIGKAMRRWAARLGVAGRGFLADA